MSYGEALAATVVGAGCLLCLGLLVAMTVHGVRTLYYAGYNTRDILLGLALGVGCVAAFFGVAWIVSAVTS